LAAPQLVVAFCRAADAAEFDGVWFADHLVVPRAMGSDYTLRSKPFPMSFEELRATMGLALELKPAARGVRTSRPRRR
jgi:alkanesulfonate monooxygenase SsuD/methylene tetrahydromethanopterin reductase-like flavin-dependent oxidoreductase (luciferase family)